MLAGLELAGLIPAQAPNFGTYLHLFLGGLIPLTTSEDCQRAVEHQRVAPIQPQSM
jgi:hypothetical protein